MCYKMDQGTSKLDLNVIGLELGLSQVSPSAQELVASMLKLDPADSMTAPVSLQHRWLAGHEAGSSVLKVCWYASGFRICPSVPMLIKPSKQVQANLRSWRAHMRMKKAMLATVAANRWIEELDQASQWLMMTFGRMRGTFGKDAWLQNQQAKQFIPNSYFVPSEISLPASCQVYVNFSHPQRSLHKPTWSYHQNTSLPGPTIKFISRTSKHPQVLCFLAINIIWFFDYWIKTSVAFSLHHSYFNWLLVVVHCCWA